MRLGGQVEREVTGVKLESKPICEGSDCGLDFGGYPVDVHKHCLRCGSPKARVWVFSDEHRGNDSLGELPLTDRQVRYEVLKEAWGEFIVDGEGLEIKIRQTLVELRDRPDEGGQTKMGFRLAPQVIAIEPEKPFRDAVETSLQAPGSEVQIEPRIVVQPAAGLIVRQIPESIYRTDNGAILAFRTTVREVRILHGRTARGDPLVNVSYDTNIVSAPKFLMDSVLNDEDEVSASV